MCGCRKAKSATTSAQQGSPATVQQPSPETLAHPQADANRR